jgi:hypothetical protein
MIKTLVKTAILAAAASLAMSGQSWAHHPSADMNPNYDFVDGQVSDTHNEVIDAMLEDGDLMRSSRSTDGSTAQVQEVGGATTSAQARAVSGPGAGRR